MWMEVTSHVCKILFVWRSYLIVEIFVDHFFKFSLCRLLHRQKQPSALGRGKIIFWHFFAGVSHRFPPRLKVSYFWDKWFFFSVIIGDAKPKSICIFSISQQYFKSSLGMRKSLLRDLKVDRRFRTARPFITEMRTTSYRKPTMTSNKLCDSVENFPCEMWQMARNSRSIFMKPMSAFFS